MFDTHTHLNLSPLSSDPSRYLALAKQAGVSGMMVVGTDLATSITAVELATQYPEILASVGIHPEEASTNSKIQISNFKQIETLLPDPKIRAIGECGLDYSGDVDHSAQKELFQFHIELAQRLDLPLIIHCRNTRSADQHVEGNAYEDLITLLEQTASTPCFVLHCVSGPLDYVHRALALGAYISFAGNVTYPNAHAIREIAKITPHDRLLVETDAPFLAPQTHRGQTNEPAYVVETGKFLADFLGMEFAEFDHLTTANAKRFFRI